MTFLVGPEAHQPFFTKTDKEIAQDEPYRFCIPIFGPNVVYDCDVAHRSQQMKFIKKSLASESLVSYVPMIVKESEDYFNKWGQSGQVDIRDALSELIILTASRCLMGKEIRENLFSEVSHLYQLLDEGLTPISVFWPYLPIPQHRRRDQAREAMVELFKKIIVQRQKEPDVKHDDVLQALMDAEYREGRQLTHQEITGLMIALLFAGQHTSSVTGSWTGLLLLQNKNHLNEALKEQEESVAKYGNKLTYEELMKMDKLHRCVKEALRMYPPLIFVMRTVIEPFTVQDYYIPKGDVLMVSPALSMRDSRVFANPDQYDPDRFTAPRNEDSTKFGYLGFGAGRHGCMGEQFAYLQIKTIWSVLLRNFDMELVGELPKPDYKAMVVGPTHPCMIKYVRKTNK
eukprot:TRINITY_DN5940_c0_g1_i5.p1 TRINITY_DN5940_c0_g1~~TRINITY_DN5940_c0_g1_i5.p1  ORF type:complete len:400 (+),score=80.61 TRINITY_DN5940_c0_g1_i5:351-1550(+)